MDNSAQTNPTQSTPASVPTETPVASSPPTPLTSPTAPEPTIEQTQPIVPTQPTIETPVLSIPTSPTTPTSQTIPADQAANQIPPTTMPDPFAQASAAVLTPTLDTQTPTPITPTADPIQTESTMPPTDPQAPPPANPVAPTPPPPTTQTPPTTSKGGSAFKTILIVLIILGILAAAARFVLPAFGINVPFLSASKQNLAKVCAQVVTPAKNIQTGECKEFPTPCDIPAGWTKVSSCITAPTPTIDATANWKTYTNTKNNYSIKYPSTLILVKGPGTNLPDNEFQKLDTISFSGLQNEASNSGVTLTISVNPTDANGKAIKCTTDNVCLEKILTTLNKSSNDVVNINQTIMGKDVKGVEYKNVNKLYEQVNRYFVFFENGKVWQISLTINNYNASQIQNLNTSFNQILATFKFTNSTPSATPSVSATPTEKNSSDSAKTATPTPKLVQ